MKSYLKTLSEAYYEGNPIVSNEEYDALEAIYGQVLEGAGEIPHTYRMYSLQKHYEDQGTPPLVQNKCVKSPKLDGAAISLLYVNGSLALALTRGDGKKGRDVTEKLRQLVPSKVKLDGVVQITGEVVAISTVENSRNYASGALNLKDINEYTERVADGDMAFFAYSVFPYLTESYSKDMTALSELCGFKTVFNSPTDKYPLDGTVYRLENNREYDSLGATDKFPRGAYALKTRQEAVVTKLLNVVWSTGKSGKVTPVALLEPVTIGEAVISKATLNNIAYIEALNLEIGCLVEVIRSGEIIPKIVGRYEE